MSTYTIDNHTLSEPEIAMLLRVGRRGPDAASRGQQCAQQVSTRVAGSLGVVATSVWLVNVLLVAGAHAA
jgi:hypothetical protein